MIRWAALALALASCTVTPALAQDQAPTPPQARTVLLGRNRDGVVSWKRAAALAPLHVRGAYRVIDGVAADVTLDGLYADGIGRTGVRLAKGSRNVTIRNFRLEHGPTPNVSPHLPEGIDLQGCVHCVIEDGYISGFRTTGMAYPNGDGLNVEHGDEDITIRRVVSENHSDSAFDWLKGSNIRGYDLTGRDAARCLKTGAFGAYISALTCVDTRTAVEFHGGDIIIDVLDVSYVRRTAPSWVISMEAGGGANRITIRECRFHGTLPAGSVVVAKGPGVTADLGPTCRAWPNE